MRDYFSRDYAIGDVLFLSHEARYHEAQHAGIMRRRNKIHLEMELPTLG